LPVNLKSNKIPVKLNKKIFYICAKLITMKSISIIITLVGIAVLIYCLTYFSPALNVVDSDPLTVNPKGHMTAEWPLFVGILTTFVGITFFFVSLNDKTAKK